MPLQIRLIELLFMAELTAMPVADNDGSPLGRARIPRDPREHAMFQRASGDDAVRLPLCIRIDMGTRRGHQPGSAVTLA
jgi:hypothetical protein